MCTLNDQLIKIEEQLSLLDDELEKEKRFQSLVESKRINLLNLWNLVRDSEGGIHLLLSRLNLIQNLPTQER